VGKGGVTVTIAFEGNDALKYCHVLSRLTTTMAPDSTDHLSCRSLLHYAPSTNTFWHAVPSEKVTSQQRWYLTDHSCNGASAVPIRYCVDNRKNGPDKFCFMESNTCTACNTLTHATYASKRSRSARRKPEAKFLLPSQPGKTSDGAWSRCFTKHSVGDLVTTLERGCGLGLSIAGCFRAP
jgi:hypothetical protein